MDISNFYELPSNLRACSRLLTKDFDEAIKPSGVTLNQLFMLLYLKENKFYTIASMARSLYSERTTISRNLQPLLKGGYVVKLKSKDHKLKNYGLTEKGICTLKQAVSLFELNLVSLSDKCKGYNLKDLDIKLREFIKYLTI